MRSGRPALTEYDPKYSRYMELVPEDDIASAMDLQHENTVACLSALPAAMADRRYAPGKWTIREVLGHILDAERIFGFRLLAFARGDAATFARTDENLYVQNGDFSRHPLAVWLEEFSGVRRSHVALVRHLPSEAWERIGTVSGATVSVRAVAYLMVGHERHHLRVIQEKYLGAPGSVLPPKAPHEEHR